MLSQSQLERCLRIERFRRPKASPSGLKLAVLAQVKKDPSFYERYDEFSGKTLGDGKPHRFTLGESHSLTNPNSAKDVAFHEGRAKKAKLVSLPLNMKGANCGNCSMYEPFQPNGCEGHCSHKEVDQTVHDTEHCKYWENPDAKIARQDER